VEFAIRRFTTSMKDTADEEAHESKERLLGLGVPLPSHRAYERRSHSAFIVLIMSPVILSVSTSSTKCMNVVSREECSMSLRMASVVSWASTLPCRRINRWEQTCSTTSRTCEQ